MRSSGSCRHWRGYVVHWKLETLGFDAPQIALRILNPAKLDNRWPRPVMVVELSFLES